MNENKQADSVAWEVVFNAVKQAITLCKNVTGEHSRISTYVNAVQITHDALGTDNNHPAPAVARVKPVHFRAVLCSEQQNQAVGVVPKVVGFVDKKSAEQFILEKRDFQGWKYNLEPLYSEAPAVAQGEFSWAAGEPPKWFQEWFIAKLDNGQRVVLKRLPEEFTYDYKTADETYYAKRRIAKWMQFPDSEFVDLSGSPAVAVNEQLLKALVDTDRIIAGQLELIEQRASGDFLNKRPVVQSLAAHRTRIQKAIAAAEINKGE